MHPAILHFRHVSTEVDALIQVLMPSNEARDHASGDPAFSSRFD
jgi:hypothetical protein